MDRHLPLELRRTHYRSKPKSKSNLTRLKVTPQSHKDLAYGDYGWRSNEEKVFIEMRIHTIIPKSSTLIYKELESPDQTLKDFLRQNGSK